MTSQNLELANAFRSNFDYLTTRGIAMAHQRLTPLPKLMWTCSVLDRP
jgi:hypothetical protein